MINQKNNIGFFYILTNIRNNVLYTGSTTDLIRRIKEHKKGRNSKFTKEYYVNRLICYEIFENINEARKRERKVKGWLRKRKIELIESKNKEWKDFFDQLRRDPSLRSG